MRNFVITFYKAGFAQLEYIKFSSTAEQTLDPRFIKLALQAMLAKDFTVEVTEEELR